MLVGEKKVCTIIEKRNGEWVKTDQTIPVEVREVKRNHATQQLESVRVKTLESPKRFLWVQAEMLS